ncbi:MAG: hypothetical protein KF878_19565 [Planctomycetes bacterium]|nr:hypothetical protein [Planctomycetota bacterium]
MLDQHEAASTPGSWPGGAERGLFGCAFVALFAELMLIRWVPAALELVSYYSNLLLVSSFFGLGVGVLLAHRRPALFGWFPALLLLEVCVILGAKRVTLAGATPSDELRFMPELADGGAQTWSLAVLVAVFAVNSAVLVPIGQRLGELFGRAPVLRAYTFDLGGSLAGTIAFGAFSYVAFSPVVGMAIPLGVHALMATRRQRLFGLPLGVAALVAMGHATAPGALWSPYHYIVVQDPAGGPPPDAPPPDVRTMTNPPYYVVAVNHTFYQYHGTLDPARYDGAPAGSWRPAPSVLERHALPHLVRPGARSALVLGAGGGLDVESVLLHGVTEVDAVDIDPGLIALARRWSANGVYDDPRVRVHADDARAFLERDTRTYDCVVYGLLDSQALFSTMSNVRLDGYVYTLEGLRAGWRRVAPGGVLSLSFYVANQQWLAVRLARLVTLATGREPLLFTEGMHLVAVVTRGDAKPPGELTRFRQLERLAPDEAGVVVPTDDWPFLYLRERTIPRDYLLVLVTLAAGVVVTVAAARPVGGRLGAPEAQAFFLGAGFLLLQTKSITDCSVYFGATWLVTTVVVTGVLLMVLLANLATIKGVGRASYVSLFAALVVTCAMPREWILGLPLGGRLAWAALAVPLPIFFAGQIFSTAFRAAPRPAALFGANLLGATLGGLCEYGAMIVGSRGLSVLLIGLYALSLVAARRAAPAAMRE